MSKKTKTLFLCLGAVVLAAAVAMGIWFFVQGKDASHAGNVLGVEWYDEKGTEFTIHTIEQFRELAELSGYYDFKGQTIHLGADLTDNYGTATDWENEIPEHIWKPIRNFAGTFDGEGHTISGICGYGFIYKATTTPKQYDMERTGLFIETQADCVIKDFRLVNSFFYSDFSTGVGSITSNGGGTFDSIYSNATVLSYKENVGGLIGMLDARGSHTVTNCWFDGELRIEGTFGRYASGIVGRVLDTGGQSKIEHCLNTGVLTSTTEGRGVNLGGIVGNVAPQGRVTLQDCLNVGSLSNEYGIGAGSVIGVIEGNGSANVVDVYTTLDSYPKVIGATLGDAHGLPMEYDRTMLLGFGGYKWTNLDFDEYWAVVEDGTPILKYFASTAPSVEGVKKGFDLSWYEKGKTEFEINSREQLYGLAILSRSTDFSGKKVKLSADIVINEGDAKGWAEKEPEYNWVPISTVDYPFAGVFDGQMHTISGVYLKTDSPYSGLFSTTGDEAAIKNLKLVNSYFASDAATFGSIVGRGRGSFDTIYSNAMVVSTKTNLGGLIGQVPSESILHVKNCWFDGSVTHKGNSLADRRCGGLIGVMYSNVTVEGCLNSGTIDATSYTTPNTNNNAIIVPLAGGLVGVVPKEIQLTLDNCLNVGQIKVNDAATAGYGSVVGYVDGSVSVSSTYGVKDSCDKHAVRNSLAGEIAVVDAVALAGYGAYQRTLLDFDTYWAVDKSGTPILKSFASDVPTLASVEKKYDVSWYNSDGNTYTIDSVKDLYGFYLLSYNTDFSGKTVKVGADITVNSGKAGDWAKSAPSNKWTPIGSNTYPFAGTFDGGMHTISGIYLKADAPYAGLFGVTADKATIKNLKLKNSYLETSEMSIGSIAGRGRGTFDTIYSNAIVVSSTGNLGGIIGQIPTESKVKVSNCWFDGSVRTSGNTFNDRRTGGIVGVTYSNLTICHCLNTGTIDASRYTMPNTNNNAIVVPLAGGILGTDAKNVISTISDCLNMGKIVVSSAANAGYGPMAGYREGTMTVEKAYATADCCDTFTGSRLNGLITPVDTATLKGYGAYQWTLLDFNGYWTVVADGAPILKSFASVVPSLAGVEKMISFDWQRQAKGTAEDPYLLKSVADLYGLSALAAESDFAGKHFKLDADIVVNSGSAGDWNTSEPERTWTPIGSNTHPFAGTFDGCMHSISGVYLKTNISYSGLFGVTADQATVKNLKLVNSYFETSAMSIGSIAGRGRGTFDTIYSNAIVVSSTGNLGGIIGQIPTESKVKVSNCWFDGSVTTSGNSFNDRRAGGIVGVAFSDFTISHCLNTGTIDASQYTMPNTNSTMIVPLAGGIIGTDAKNVASTISDCLNTGKILVNSAATAGYGPMAGYREGTMTVEKAYATADCCDTFTGSRLNGLITPVDTATLQGYGAYQWTLLDFTGYWAVVEKGTPILKSFASVVSSLAGVEKMISFDWQQQAAGTAEDPYLLKSAADLYGLSALAAEDNFAGKYFKLGADITVNSGDAADWREAAPSYAWTPIGNLNLPFAGTFDGDMHTISGIYLNTTERYAGLFGVTSAESTVKNLKLKNSYIKTTAADAGSIAGKGDGTFTAIYSDAIIDCGAARSGGLVGQVGGADSKITSCWFAGTITNSSANAQGTGGMVGIVINNAKLTMESCLCSGTVDVSSISEKQPYAGGLVGQVGQGGACELVLNDSLMAGILQVNAAHTTGYGAGVGMVSKNASSTITNTYFTPESSNRSIAVASGSTYNGVPGKAGGSILGVAAKTTMPKLAWDTAWQTVPGTIPALCPFAEEALDANLVNLSWQKDAAGTEEDPYLLKSAADLYGLSALATESNFAGKYFKLDADITVNSGDAADWRTTAPERAWTPIGSLSLRFAGTFDGDMHTISGIYLNTTERYAGLFGVTSAESTVKSLKLKNSYIKTTAADAGSIAGKGDGTFTAIYSDAIIDCTGARSGGLVGQVGGADSKITSCWFAGTITNSSANAQGTGGLAGNVINNAKLTMESCLCSGTVDVSSISSKQPYAGGLVGQIGQGGACELVLNDSLMAGILQVNAAHTTGYGAGVGMVSKNASSTITNTYFTPESSNRSIAVATGSTYSGVPAKTSGSILGAAAKTTMPKLAWDTAWITVEESAPILKVFEESDEA